MGKSFKQMGYKERTKIKEMRDKGITVSEIADKLGYSQSGIYRELKFGKDESGEYNPEFAQEKYKKNSLNKGHHSIIENDTKLAEHIAKLILEQNMSPEQIVKELQQEKECEWKKVPLSPHTIYSAIYNGLLPGVSKESLNKSKTKIFSNGLLRFPNWFMISSISLL